MISQAEWEAALGELVRPVGIMHRIAWEIAQNTGVTLDDLRGPEIDRMTVAARHLFMFKAHEAGNTSVEIGDFLGRDHTTVLYGIKKIKRKMERANA